MGLFFTYYNFLPISYYFLDTYRFVMCRSYFSTYGYLLISQQSLSNYNYSLSDNLLDFSAEFKLLKKFKVFNQNDTFKYFFIRTTIFNSYFRFYMYYLQSFFDLDEVEDSVFTPHSLILFANFSIKRNGLANTLVIYDLNKMVDFYAFNRNTTQIFLNLKPKMLKLDYTFLKTNFYSYIKKLKKTYINLYKKSFKVKFFFLNKKLHKSLVAKYSNDTYVFINKEFKKNLQDSLTIRFSDSSVSKYIPMYNLNQYKLYFLRKNRIFNKSRYSRNRQLYRTGFYWCLWLNIIVVYGLYYYFYRFTLNFGYMWVLLFIFFSSFILSRVFQFKLYSLSNILLEFYNFYVFTLTMFSNLKSFFFKFV